MYNFIKVQYDMGRISADEVRAFSPAWITPEQAEEIIGGGINV